MAGHCLTPLVIVYAVHPFHLIMPWFVHMGDLLLYVIMRSETLLQNGWDVFVMMFSSNLHYSHLLVRGSFQPLLISKMMLVQIYMLVGFGVAGKVPFLM